MPTRDFVFIDEHGDPGLPGQGSSHFASIALHTTDEELEQIVDCFASFRFYRQFYRELKNIDSDPRLRPKLVQLLECLNSAHSVAFSVTYLEKSRYTGPYLRPTHGTEFRNFQVRRLLEWHFKNSPVRSGHCELVLDRVAHSLGQLENLRDYLNSNYGLPPFSAITTVDSRYVEMIQVADMALRLFRRKSIQQNPGWASLDLSFIQHRDVSQMSKGWTP